MTTVNGYSIEPNADLCDADLCDANLRGADLRGLRVKAIERCQQINLPITLAMTVNETTLPHLWETIEFGLDGYGAALDRIPCRFID